MFHEGLVSELGENEDGYEAKTIALANCCPPFRYVSTIVCSSSAKVIACLFMV